MTIEQVKKEIWYYAGKRASTLEAEDILEFIEANPKTPIDEIISDYYGC